MRLEDPWREWVLLQVGDSDVMRSGWSMSGLPYLYPRAILKSQCQEVRHRSTTGRRKHVQLVDLVIA